MKDKKETLKKQVLKKIVKKSTEEAEWNINSACVWWLNQPVPPKELEKLKKL